jgi:AcrR family transcriptional regulator
MSQIAEETRVGRATLYKYFPDVDAILVAWDERHVIDLRRMQRDHRFLRSGIGRHRATGRALIESRHGEDEAPVCEVVASANEYKLSRPEQGRPRCFRLRTGATEECL